MSLLVDIQNFIIYYEVDIHYETFIVLKLLEDEGSDLYWIKFQTLDQQFSAGFKSLDRLILEGRRVDIVTDQSIADDLLRKGARFSNLVLVFSHYEKGLESETRL